MYKITRPSCITESFDNTILPKMLHPRDPPTQETQSLPNISQCKFRLEFWCRFEIVPRILSFSIRWFRGCSSCSGSDALRVLVIHELSVTWLVHMCDMIHSFEWQVSFKCVKWLIHMCGMTFFDASTPVPCLCSATSCYTWLYCDMIHLCVWCGSCIHEARIIHTRATTHSYACHDSFIRVPWLIHKMWALVIHGSFVYKAQFVRVRSDSFIHKGWLIHTCG